jgi:hypothetical protein
MDTFLDVDEKPKLNQMDKNQLSRSIISSEIEAVIKSPLTKKSPWLGVFTAKSYQPFKEHQNPSTCSIK